MQSYIVLLFHQNVFQIIYHLVSRFKLIYINYLVEVNLLDLVVIPFLIIAFVRILHHNVIKSF